MVSFIWQWNRIEVSYINYPLSYAAYGPKGTTRRGYAHRSHAKYKPFPLQILRRRLYIPMRRSNTCQSSW